MTAKTRWGILATGWIADLFVKDLLLTGHIVTAVGSRSQTNADRFAKRFGIPNVHASYESLAADPEVDVIYIATPHPMHTANAKMALTAGKHVLIEKPFTLNAAEAEEVVALAQSNRLVALEAMWTRFLPHMVNIRKIVASGVLGELRSVIADHTQDLPDDPAHRLNALELGGGGIAPSIRKAGTRSFNSPIIRSDPSFPNPIILKSLRLAIPSSSFELLVNSSAVKKRNSSEPRLLIPI